MGTTALWPYSNGAVRIRSERTRRAEKWLSKRVFLESPFSSAASRFSGVLISNLKVAEKKRTLQKHPFGQAQHLLRSFGAPPILFMGMVRGWRSPTIDQEQAKHSWKISTLLRISFACPEVLDLFIPPIWQGFWSGHVRPRQWKSAISGRRLHWIFVFFAVDSVPFSPGVS